MSEIETYVPGWRWDEIYLLWISGWLRYSRRMSDGDGERVEVEGGDK